MDEKKNVDMRLMWAIINALSMICFYFFLDTEYYLNCEICLIPSMYQFTLVRIGLLFSVCAYAWSLYKILKLDG